MLTGLRGLVFKSDYNESGQTEYTIILGKKLIFPWQYKTATIYKDWRGYSPNLELVINERDKRKYKKEIKAKRTNYLNDDEELTLLNEDVKNLPQEEREALRRNIENIPEKIKKGFYEIFEGLLFPVTGDKSLYGFEKQKISNINSDSKTSLSGRLSEKVYKKALSVINILPL
jgi:hypothetical protein